MRVTFGIGEGHTRLTSEDFDRVSAIHSAYKQEPVPSGDGFLTLWQGRWESPPSLVNSPVTGLANIKDVISNGVRNLAFERTSLRDSPILVRSPLWTRCKIAILAHPHL